MALVIIPGPMLVDLGWPALLSRRNRHHRQRNQPGCNRGHSRTAKANDLLLHNSLLWCRPLCFTTALGLSDSHQTNFLVLGRRYRQPNERAKDKAAQRRLINSKKKHRRSQPRRFPTMA